ncbi:hypothetical protein QUC31_018374 [Theobroma cacao]|nr:UDP-glucuronosyl/UDP-glucosyltransferase - like 10 [Theobroma cacao]
MASEKPDLCHVVALPYPGRGHVNPMMNLCKFITRKRENILITFVVTEEWLGFISSNAKHSNIRLASIPNVIPSELVRADDFPGFIQAVRTKMTAPFEELLDRLELPVTTILTDAALVWAIHAGNYRNIPVAALRTSPATVFSMLCYLDLFKQNGHFPVDLSEQGQELVDYIPGIPPIRVADLPTFFSGDSPTLLRGLLETLSSLTTAHYLLFNSVYELEAPVFDTLKEKFSIPLYPVGPNIPCFELEDISSANSAQSGPDYLEWLNSQPTGSVLYVSMGSFLSASTAQMDAIFAGVINSGVRYILVARSETFRFTANHSHLGLVVPWCNQMKVLCHSSVGGFLTHCGWNSTLEAVFAGVPMLTFPLFWDQVTNSKRIVEDWKIGWRMKRDAGSNTLTRREEISDLVQRFMDPESSDRMEMVKRARKLQDICQAAVAEGGSSDTNLDAFIGAISNHPPYQEC